MIYYVFFHWLNSSLSLSPLLFQLNTIFLASAVKYAPTMQLKFIFRLQYFTLYFDLYFFCTASCQQTVILSTPAYKCLTPYYLNHLQTNGSNLGSVTQFSPITAYVCHSDNKLLEEELSSLLNFS